MSDTEVLDYETRVEREPVRERDRDDDVRMEPQPYPQYQRPQGHFQDRRIDHIGLQPHIDSEEDVLYEVKDDSTFHVTRALFIANLRRPINSAHFQEYLKGLAQTSGGYLIERAWLNRGRTHAIVLVNTEEGARTLRSKLVGSIYPPEEEDAKLKQEFENIEVERYESEVRQYEDALARAQDEDEKSAIQPPVEPRNIAVERHTLYVDYIPVKAINQWVFEEDKGPRDGKWKIDYEFKGDETVATHTLLNGDFIPRYPGPPPRRSYRRGPPRDFDYREGPPPYRNHGRPYGRPPPRFRGGYGRPRGERDSYIPGGNNDRSDDRRSRRTDSYEPSRNRERSRSPL
ncbi:uncharacterized protein SPAPADRAFT_63062 [Spathaspora passalidarum NRRL Y-27907]|uniref:Uncharacterized protein n=1 Tax=Spathaspora passalidarum (strain NRRL Y-27907 / 11-Y1) TaxID=619300 RepID=G3AST7_SPAPN|nr:uncharacterized protein SPAPADRAFT_63062 [Spathaspora passalidarum NRRL Y-27907]EGW31150.1 hypothetical protein SPAPADRAFT_63062 [Spathaspora passalidarum NRRL Y-27907]